MNKNLKEKLIFSLFGAVTALVVLVTVAILVFIIFRGIGQISWDFISKAPENGMMEGGIFPAIMGTLLLITGSCVLAFPIGVLSGIFMNEYAHENAFKRIVTMMTSNLAGIPSIVFGLFGLALFVNFFKMGVSLMAGCCTLAILVLPVIIRTTEEALKQIDDTYRFSGYALGASKFKTVLGIILPMAMPNIITGLILSIGRVAGETAPIIFTVAAYYLSEISFSLQSPVMALPYHLYVMATSGIDLEKSRSIAFGTALILMSIVLIMNLLAGGVKRFYSK